MVESSPESLREAVERELHRVMCGGRKHRSHWAAQCIVMAPNIARGLAATPAPDSGAEERSPLLDELRARQLDLAAALVDSGAEADSFALNLTPQQAWAGGYAAGRKRAALGAEERLRAALREAYIEALVTAWEQAHHVAARIPNENGVGIVSNIEERFRPFIPDWREAGAEAARRASLSGGSVDEEDGNG
jgi:hypothetical protein